MYMKTAALALGCVVGLAANANSLTPTFTKDVVPIFQAKCQECHRPGDIAPMSLLTYETTRPWAKSIKRKVVAREMPPFHAEKGKFPFANDTTLTEQEVETIVAWVDQGVKRGNPDDLPPPADLDPDHWRAGTPDLVLQPDSPYTLGADVDDEYRCYVIPTNFTEDVWINGIEYRPGNREVVHHIMAYIDTSGRARPKDEATPEAGFLCGMSGDQSTMQLDQLLGGWAPGTPPNMSDVGHGRLIPAGADIVYQVHYHNVTGQAQIDHSSMGLHFAKEPIMAEDRIFLVGAYQLKINAGDANAEHKGYWTAPKDLILSTVMPHMHYLGKDMTVNATFPDGRKETLLDVPRYDFNWQIVYAYEEPMLIPKGTRFEMISHHDNSADNPANPSNPPKDVAWGEATDEEMAHAWLSYTYADEKLNITPTPPSK